MGRPRETDKIPTIPFAKLGKFMRSDSERWFPELHTQDHTPMMAFYALGLAGETGEVCNEIKKLLRNVGGDPKKIGAELADVLTYLLLLADELKIDLFFEYLQKRDVNEARWGLPLEEEEV